MVKERFGAVSVEQLYLAMKITLHLFHDKGVLFSPPRAPFPHSWRAMQQDFPQDDC